MIYENEVRMAGVALEDGQHKRLPNGTDIGKFRMRHVKPGREGRPDIITDVTVKSFGGWSKRALRVREGDNVIVKGEINVCRFRDKTDRERFDVELIAQAIKVVKDADDETEES